MKTINGNVYFFNINFVYTGIHQASGQHLEVRRKKKMNRTNGSKINNNNIIQEFDFQTKNMQLYLCEHIIIPYNLVRYNVIIFAKTRFFFAFQLYEYTGRSRTIYFLTRGRFSYTALYTSYTHARKKKNIYIYIQYTRICSNFRGIYLSV